MCVCITRMFSSYRNTMDVHMCRMWSKISISANDQFISLNFGLIACSMPHYGIVYNNTSNDEQKCTILHPTRTHTTNQSAMHL
jgi:hypothetical protein